MEEGKLLAADCHRSVQTTDQCCWTLEAIITPYQVALLCRKGETQGSGDIEKKTDVEFYSAVLIKLRRLELSRIDKRS
jgi:hypothetical protein